MLRQGLIVGLGNPLLDISASVNEEFLQKYKLQPNNAILAEAQHMPIYEEIVNNFQVEYTAGGSTQNVLRVAQWILKKPNVAVFMGAVGKDKYSDILADKARSEGVNVQYQYNENTPTGTCAVLITDNGHKRSLCANLAAANLFTIDHIQKPENNDIIQKATYFYISGFFVTVSPNTIMEVANVALEENKMLIMNLSAPFICTVFKDRIIKALPYVDILIGNETEAEAFAKEEFPGITDLSEIAVRLSKWNKLNKKKSRIVIITQGHNPILLVKDGTVEEYPVSQLPAEKIIDTNGAGDAFAGGLLAQLVQEKPMKKCIDCGIWAASQVIQQNGCTYDKDAIFLD